MPEFFKGYDHLFPAISKHRNIQVKLTADENIKPVTQKSPQKSYGLDHDAKLDFATFSSP